MAQPVHNLLPPMVQCVARWAPICSNVYGGWVTPCPRHSVRLTYRSSTALWLLRSLRISHNKFLWANKWILNTCSTFFVQVQQQNVSHWWDWLHEEANQHISNHITQIPATSSEQCSRRCTSGNPHQLLWILSNSAQYHYHSQGPAASGAPNQDTWTASWSTGRNSLYSWSVLSHRWVLA